ncbi:hypothetical protein ACQAYK_11740 [Acidithiobacillus sp. AC3]
MARFPMPVGVGPFQALDQQGNLVGAVMGPVAQVEMDSVALVVAAAEAVRPDRRFRVREAIPCRVL